MRGKVGTGVSDSAPSTPPARRTLRSNISWTTLGNVIYAACQWGIITALAKIGTPAMVGQFALALAVTAPIVQFLNFSLRSVQATDARREYEFQDYFTLRTVTTALAVVLILGVAGLGAHSRETTAVIMLVGIAKAVDAISDIFYGLLQQREQMDVVSKALVTNGILSLILLTLGILASGTLLLGVVGYVVGSFVPLAAYVAPRGVSLLRGSELSPVWKLFRWRADIIRRLARTALPLGIVMLLISLNTNVPRYFIEAELGQRELGVFAALAYLIVAGGTVVSAIGQAVSPRLSQYHAQGERDAFRGMIKRLMVFGLGLGVLGAIVAALTGSEILSLLYTDEYSEYVDILVVLALAAGITFAAAFAGYGMTATRRFRVQVPLFLTVGLVGFSSAWLLIPRFGLIGAAYVLCLTALAQLAGATLVIQRSTRND